MAIRTKYSLAEEILRTLNGGELSDRDRASFNEIYPKIESEGAKFLKAMVLDTNFNQDGNSYTDGLLVATFPALPVTQVPGTKLGEVFSQFTLPVAPMILPENQGIANVFPAGLPFGKTYFSIPKAAYQQQKDTKRLNNLAQTWYIQQGMTVTVTDDLIGDNITTVDVEIATPGLTQLSENDPLPFPEDICNNIIQGVIQLYGFQPRTERSEALQPNPAKGD